MNEGKRSVNPRLVLKSGGYGQLSLSQYEARRWLTVGRVLRREEAFVMSPV